MIHTIVPLESLMEAQESPKCEWIAREGRFFEVYKNGETQNISRVFSTDLKDYLNPKFSPGERFE